MNKKDIQLEWTINTEYPWTAQFRFVAKMDNGNTIVSTRQITSFHIDGANPFLANNSDEIVPGMFANFCRMYYESGAFPRIEYFIYQMAGIPLPNGKRPTREINRTMEHQRIIRKILERRTIPN